MHNIAPSADINMANANRILRASARAGAACTSTGALIEHDSVAATIREKFWPDNKSLQIGHPSHQKL